MDSRWGVMQGRFTDKGAFSPQQFPWNNWEKEFQIARQNGISGIEWMFNMENYRDNPIWTRHGRQEIRSVMKASGVRVFSVCANYFMERTLDTLNGILVLQRLLDAGEELGAEHIIFPMFGASNVGCQTDLTDLLGKIAQYLQGREIRVCIESDMPVDWQVLACELVQTEKIGICYDVGNAAGNGYDFTCDLENAAMAGCLSEVHLKDKKYRGSSVMLGCGDVDFRMVFHTIAGCDCLKVFESYFGTNAVDDTVKNIAYIREVLGYGQKDAYYWPGKCGTEASEESEETLRLGYRDSGIQG